MNIVHAALKPITILLADGSEDDSLVIRDLLAGMTDVAAQVEWVSTYDAAYAAFAQGQYDVCLLDYGLSGHRGLELLQALPADILVPIILLTGTEDHKVDMTAARAGAADYLVKRHINAPLLERSLRYAIERKKTEAALLHAQRFAQATVDALPGHIAVLDSRGTIITVNATWREFAASNGFIGAESIIGTNYLEVCDQSDEADGRAAAACIRAVIAGEEPISALEYPCDSPTTRQWFWVSATRFPGEGPLHVVVAHENITERKLAAQQFEVHSHLLNVIGQAVVVTDSVGKITYWNAFAEKLYGWSSVEVLGRDILDVTPAETTQEQAAEILACLSRGESWSGEFLVQKRDGTKFPAYVTDTPVLDKAGDVVSIIGISLDITERKQAEETSTLLAAIVESSDDAIISKTLDGIITTWNAGAENLYGYTAQEAIGRSVAFLAPSDLSDEMAELLEKIRHGEQIKQYETVRVRKDGSRFDISLSISPLKNAEGVLIGASSIKRDITERKQAEETLRQSEARSSAVIQYALDCIITINHEGRVVEFNPAAEATFGYTRAEALGQDLNDLIVPPAFHEGHTGGIAHYLATGEGPLLNRRVEVPARRKDGTEISVELAATAITHSNPPLFTASLRDITERKLAENLLFESQQRLALATESAHIGIWDWNVAANELQWDAQMVALYGIREQDFSGAYDAWKNGLHPEDRERVEADINAAFQGSRDFDTQFRVVWPTGEVRHIEAHATVQRAENGTALRMVGVNRDVTERQRAEESLRESEERFQSIVANMPGMVYQFILQPDGLIEMPFVSEGCRELYDLEPEDIRRNPELVLDLVYPADRADFERSIAVSAQTLLPWRWQGSYLHPSGQTRWVQGAARPRRLPNGGTLWDGVLLDITARKESEEERDRFFTLSLDMLAIVGSDGYFKRLNPAFEATLGFSDAELMAVPFLEWVHPDDIDAALAKMAKLKSGVQVTSFESRYRCRDGSYKWLHWTSAPFEDLWYCVAHDITGIKQAAAALQKANDDLELRVEERTSELQSQVVERERAEREVRAQARQHEAVAELGRRALLDLDLEALLEGTVALIASTLELDTCSFWERLPDSDTLRFRAGVGLNEQMRSALDKKIGDNTQIGYSALLNEPVITEDLNQETRFSPALYLLDMGITSLISVPVYNEVLYGVLAACSPHRQKFSQNELHFLQAVANVLSSAIAHKSAEAKILQLNTNLQAVNESLRVENIQRQMTMETLRQFADALQLSKEEAERAMQEANAANLAKSEFLSRMSHELRTPMNAILGYSQILEMRDYVPDIQEEVEAILKAGRHLLDLINEVLDISRIEAGHLSLSLEPVPVGSTTRIALDLVRPLSTMRGIELVNEDSTSDAERYVFADQQRIKQVLVNLLSNAIKYNRERGQIFVSTMIVAGESVKYGHYGDIECSGKMRFSVRDTGPGIDPNDFFKIFLPFERLGAERTGVEGTGIGLSLCKRLVEAMNGEIGVESERGVGSTFWVELPLVSTALVSTALGIGPAVEEPTPLPDAALGQEGQDAPEDSLTILYIEDNSSNFAVVEHALALQRRAINLLAAEQGSVGLDLARSHQPDLILLDLHLPDIMGDVVLQRLQAEPSTRAIPVIILSADATPRQIDRLLAAGAAAYLTKPLDLNQFFNVVEQTLDERVP